MDVQADDEVEEHAEVRAGKDVEVAEPQFRHLQPTSSRVTKKALVLGSSSNSSRNSNSNVFSIISN